MDHLATRDVVIDNLTTNGVTLTADVATRLVRNKAREIIVSLNAVDAWFGWNLTDAVWGGCI